MEQQYSYPSCAHRAAAAVSQRAGIYDGAPDVALRTAPPHAAVASGSHHFRRQTAVQVLRPLCSYLGFPRREVIEAWQCTPSGAVRAAAALAAGAYTRTIFVPDGTAPPHAAITVFRHVLRRERTVALAVPFGGEPGVDARKIVFPRIYSFAGATSEGVSAPLRPCAHSAAS